MDIKSAPIVKLKQAMSFLGLPSLFPREAGSCATDCGWNGSVSVHSFIAHGRQIKWDSEKKVQWWVVGK
jgi:hypothetical protein